MRESLAARLYPGSRIALHPADRTTGAQSVAFPSRDPGGVTLHRSVATKRLMRGVRQLFHQGRQLPSRLNPKITVSVVFVVATFMTIMDITIVNVALPTLANEFHVRPDHIDSVVVGFLVSWAVVIPASGWLGDRFGTKPIFLFALVLFTGASALCGTAQSLPQLVIYRILQGAGGGMLTPVAMAMLFRTFPPDDRARASRILVVPTALAPAAGPMIGGLLVIDLSWRWVFYVNVPIGLAALVFGALFLSLERQPESGHFDIPGFILAGTGLAALMYTLSDGPSRGWTSPMIITSGVAGAAVLALFIGIELRSPTPLVDLRLLGDSLFRSITVVAFIGTAAFLGTLYLVALFLQDGLGLSALDSGLSTFPEALGVMAGAQLAMWLYPTLGPRRLVIGGLIGVATSISLMTLVDFSTNLWWIRTVMLLLGLAMAHVFGPCQASAFATITPAATGRASTLFNASRQLGSAVGIAALTTVITTIGTTHEIMSHPRPQLSAYHWAFATAAAIALLAANLACSIDDKAAAPTMRTRTHQTSQHPRAARSGTNP
ncbi:MAG TPA: MDR family MFS transporter [Pseudonocardiaceae bacterium]|nr:MDR family MFS transporter [Pseudonocardiaceae bacterium]